MIAIIKYGMGNVGSVTNTFEYTGYDVVPTNRPDGIKQASHIVLLGVGAFADGIDGPKRVNLIETLNNEVIHNGKPFLDICLGMQLMADVGYENGCHMGLG
jgi:glutamine amidotransferase